MSPPSAGVGTMTVAEVKASAEGEAVTAIVCAALEVVAETIETCPAAEVSARDAVAEVTKPVPSTTLVVVSMTLVLLFVCWIDTPGELSSVIATSWVWGRMVSWLDPETY